MMSSYDLRRQPEACAQCAGEGLLAPKSLAEVKTELIPSSAFLSELQAPTQN